MNPMKFENVLERLKGNSEEVLTFHQKHVKAISYLDLYFNRMWKSQGFLKKARWNSDNKKSISEWELCFDNEKDITCRFLNLKFRKQYVAFKFSNYGYDKHVGEYYDDMSAYENLVYFYMLHLSRYAMKQGFPRIRFSCDSKVAERFVESSELKHYAISERLEDKTSKGMVTFELSDGTDIVSLNVKQLATTANRFFKDEYEFTVRDNWNDIRTASSQLSMRVMDSEALEIEMEKKSEVVQRYMKNKVFSNDYVGFPIVYLSLNENLMKEELDVIIWMSFYELYESKENIHELSKETREIVRKLLLDKGRLRFHNGVPEDLRTFFLSGDWKEEDNYRKKLITFLQKLKAVDGNMKLTLFHYDGSLEGLSTEAYIVIEQDNMTYWLRDFKTVFFTREEADAELKRVNQLVIDNINEKAT